MLGPGDTHVEALLEAGYAVALLLIAIALERVARVSHSRARSFHSVGFRYHAHLDVWECPAGEHLTRRHVDPVLRVVRYRARALACNACVLKIDCTDSDQGREVMRSLESWPKSEIAHFHRGMSVMLAALAGFIAVFGLARSRTSADVLVLVAALVLALALGWHLWAGFRSSSGADADWLK